MCLKAEWMGHPMRLELTLAGLLVKLVNHYTTRQMCVCQAQWSSVNCNNTYVLQTFVKKKIGRNACLDQLICRWHCKLGCIFLNRKKGQSPGSGVEADARRTREIWWNAKHNTKYLNKIRQIKKKITNDFRKLTWWLRICKRLEKTVM